MQNGERAEEYDLKGEPKGAEKRQRAKLEKRKSNICIQRVTQMYTIFKYTLQISIAFLNNILVSGGSDFSLSQQTLNNTKHVLVLD